MTKPAKFKLLLALLLVAVMGAFFFFIHSNGGTQPSYGGKTAGQWFKLAESTYGNDDACQQAFIAMGQPAVPFLVQKLHHEDGRLKTLYRQAWPRKANYLRPLVWLRPGNIDSTASTAAALLLQMGDAVRPAGADLIAVYERRYKLRYKMPPSAKIDWTEQITNPPALMTAGRMSFGPLSSVAFNCMKCLTGYCTNDEIIPMMLAAEHENRLTFNRGCPVWYSDANNTNLAPAIEHSLPLLLANINSPDIEIQNLALQMLGSLMPSHPELRPIFLEASKNPAPSIRMSALGALAKVPLEFETALPLLGRLCLDTNAAVSNTARTILFPALRPGLRFFPILSNSLASTNAAMRLGAAQIIRLYPQRAVLASNNLARLTDPANEPDEQVRAAAAETLKAISASTN